MYIIIINKAWTVELKTIGYLLALLHMKPLTACIPCYDDQSVYCIRWIPIEQLEDKRDQGILGALLQIVEAKTMLDHFEVGAQPAGAKPTESLL